MGVGRGEEREKKEVYVTQRSSDIGALAMAHRSVQEEATPDEASLTAGGADGEDRAIADFGDLKKARREAQLVKQLESRGAGVAMVAQTSGLLAGFEVSAHGGFEATLMHSHYR